MCFTARATSSARGRRNGIFRIHQLKRLRAPYRCDSLVAGSIMIEIPLDEEL